MVANTGADGAVSDVAPAALTSSSFICLRAG
jgi:hypothetical protein